MKKFALMVVVALVCSSFVSNASARGRVIKLSTARALLQTKVAKNLINRSILSEIELKNLVKPNGVAAQVIERVTDR